MKILHPTDFSTCADEARTEATRLARAFGADLLLLHVVPDVITSAEVPMDLLEQIRERQRTAAIDELEARRVEEQAAGLQATTRVEVGTPAEQIVRVADEVGAAYVVMGTHGRRALGRFFAGSVAERVVREAPCAVVTVREARKSARGAAA